MFQSSSIMKQVQFSLNSSPPGLRRRVEQAYTVSAVLSIQWTETKLRSSGLNHSLPSRSSMVFSSLATVLSANSARVSTYGGNVKGQRTANERKTVETNSCFSSPLSVYQWELWPRLHTYPLSLNTADRKQANGVSQLVFHIRCLYWNALIR